MVPTPWFPKGVPATKDWRHWRDIERVGELEGRIRVTYPRYLSIPKIATFSQGFAIAHSAYQDYKAHYAGWQPDIVDGHFAFPDGYAAVNLARKIGCSATVTCHGADLRVYPELFYVGNMLNQTLRSADRVISVSSDLKNRSIGLGCPEENAVFLTNGVDLAKFSLRTKTECRERLGLPIDRKIGVYVGYLIDRKNQSLIIQAVNEVRKRGHLTPQIVLVGDGPNRQRLQQQASAFGLNEDILFAGQRSHEEVALWMGAADWLLLSSDYEGWATVYFEALACGRPVLTSNVSSAKDAICKPEYGRVVEPTTADAFASAIIEASNQEYDAQLLRSYAEEHSWANWAKQAMSVFEKIIEEKKASNVLGAG